MAPVKPTSITTQPVAAIAAAVRPQPPKKAAGVGGGKATNASAAEDTSLLLPHVTKMAAMGELSDRKTASADGTVPPQSIIAAEFEDMTELLNNLKELNHEFTDEAAASAAAASASPADAVPLPVKKGGVNSAGARLGKKSLISQMVSGAETLFGPLFDDDKQDGGGGGGGFRRPPPPSAGRCEPHQSWFGRARARALNRTGKPGSPQIPVFVLFFLSSRELNAGLETWL